MEQTARAGELTAVQHRTVTRLESFGDIVYGFTLVLMASRLRVPEKPEDLIAELPEFGLFLLAFAILSILWYRHHMLLRDLFVPDIANVILNFMALAAIAVFAYPLELYIKFGAKSPVAFAAYAIVLGVYNVIMGVLSIRGLRQRGSHLDERSRAGAHRRGYRAAALGASFIACAAAYPFGIDTMFAALVVVALGSFIGYRLWNWYRPKAIPAADAKPTEGA
jgi:uncharacterized membrane protein